MHSLVLLTALSATTGLFGGGQGKANKCGRPAARGHYAYAPVAPCQPQAGCGTAPVAYGQPQMGCGTAPVAYYAPQTVAPAPQMMAAPQQAAYTGYRSYYAAPAAPSCAGGNCARR